MAERKIGLPKSPPVADVFPTAPPAQGQPGVTGRMPMPAGRPVAMQVEPSRMTQINPDQFTEDELVVLKQIPGWSPGDPIPANMADKLAEIGAEIGRDMLSENLKSALPPDTPPLQMPKAVPFNTLSPKHQKEIADHLAASKRYEEEQRELAGQTIDGAGAGVNAALSGQGIRQVKLEDDRESPTYATTNTPKTEAAPAVSSANGLESGLTNCPHCNWDLARSDEAEATADDKRNFVEAQLGCIQFEKEYSLFGDKLKVTFRTLHPDEVDACFRQTHSERNDGSIDNVNDFFETLMRYRLCLQLQRMQTGTTDAYVLPKSLDEWEPGWRTDLSKTPLPDAYKQVYADVLKTESINRIVGLRLTEFNQLVSRMEAMSDQTDFWKEIQ